MTDLEDAAKQVANLIEKEMLSDNQDQVNQYLKQKFFRMNHPNHPSVLSSKDNANLFKDC